MITKSQSTLSPKSMPHDDDLIDQAIDIYSKMTHDQKRRHLHWLKGQIGADDGTLNGMTKEEALDWSTVAQFLSEENERERVEAALSEIGLNAAAMERAGLLFYEVLEERLRHDPFRQRLSELLSDYLPSPFISDQKINACEILSAKINELEQAIDDIEQENAILAEEINESLDEEPAKPEKSRKRSTVESYMLEPTDEDNA